MNLGSGVTDEPSIAYGFRAELGRRRVFGKNRKYFTLGKIQLFKYFQCTTPVASILYSETGHKVKQMCAVWHTFEAQIALLAIYSIAATLQACELSASAD
jgi:hypothetical protein